MITKLKHIFSPPAKRSSLNSVLERALLGSTAATGTIVTEASALQSSAVFACVRILAESVGSLPLIVYQRDGERRKSRATQHNLHRILHDSPNPEMTSMELRETLQGHLALWGNAYAEIEYSARGQIVALWPLRPDRIEIKRDDQGQLFYRYQVDGRFIDLPAFRVLHLKGLGFDGTRGYSPIALARQSIGLALGTEEFGARFFGNGAAPGGVLEHPGILGEEAHRRLQSSWNERHEGLSNAFRLAILEEGMKYTQIGMPLEDAQFLETRKFQVNEIARWYRIPPHMIGDLERATFSNIEHQGLEFVTHTLRPWLERWEQSLELHLFTESERSRYFVEHLVEGLLRGDIKTRYEAYATGRQWGWLSINDIRQFENMNPIDNGDDYLIPLNMAPAGESASESEQQRELRSQDVEHRNADDRVALANAFERVLLDVSQRVFRREINDIRRAVGKFLVNKQAPEEFRNWLKEFYDGHVDFWIRQLSPLFLSFADQIGVAVGRELDETPKSSTDIEQFIDIYTEAFAARQTESGRMQIEALMDEALAENEEPGPAIDERLDAWENNRADILANEESSRAGNALARQYYVLLAVARLRWVNRGSENCPYCRDMDGKIVGIQEFFLHKDTDFQPEGADRPLSKRGNVGHPPLHKGCDCVIVAER